MMILACELGFMSPSVFENEKMLALSLKNWKVVGWSLSLMIFNNLLVVDVNYTSPKWIDLLDRHTSDPFA